MRSLREIDWAPALPRRFGLNPFFPILQAAAPSVADGGGFCAAGVCVAVPPGWDAVGGLVDEAPPAVESVVAGAGEFDSVLSVAAGFVAAGRVLSSRSATARKSCRQYQMAAAAAAINKIITRFRPR